MPKDDSIVISADGLTRYFGSHRVVDNLDFHVPQGKVTALLGLNGAGKTTTIRMMMGLLSPTRGSCTTLDVDAEEMPPEHLRRIGYMVEGHYLYPWMKVSELAKFCRIGHPWFDDGVFDRIVDHFAISMNQRVGQISRGQRAGVSLAAILATDPELLILDDPALGLDPVSRRALNETLVDFASGTTRDGTPRSVLLSTHLIDDVERIADEIALMISGRLLIHTTLNEFQNRVKRFGFAVPTDKNPRALSKAIAAKLPGVVEARIVGGECAVCIVDSDDSIDQKLSDSIGLSTMNGSLEQLPTSLDELVVAYLSRERSERSFTKQVNAESNESVTESRSNMQSEETGQ